MSVDGAPAYTKPWHRAQTAVAYDEYTQLFPTYQAISADLVAAAGVGAGERVVDLGCGTGVTTHAIVRRVGADGHVIAVDSAAPMIDIARRNVTAPNVTWRHARAEEVHLLCGEPVDWVISSMSFWHFDLKSTLDSVRQALARHGRLAFNDAHRAPAGGDLALDARDRRWVGRLAAGGYQVERIVHGAYQESAESLESWMRIPLWTGGGEPDRATATPAGAPELLAAGTALVLSTSQYICAPMAR
jgi:ubiquinone/menaquinone biosynthesis C-methylase UbiE